MPQSDDMPQPSSSAEKSFIAEVIAGDFGLANTYWWLGVFGGGLLSIPVAIFNEALERPKVAAVLFLIYVIYIVPVMVGIWNAAGKYKGRKVWAIAARIIAVIGALKIASVLLALPGAFA
jgi:hypothetical protein